MVAFLLDRRYIGCMNSEKFRNSLVNAATPAETRLLQILDSEPLLKDKYRFQVNLKPYFVDFYIPAKKLVVEIDGSAHMVRKEEDKKRTQYLIDNYKVKVIRVSNWEVFNNSKNVISKILRYGAVKRNIRNKAEFYGYNPLAVSRGAMESRRKRNAAHIRKAVER
jgi:very-short-patch-repair endonuclease